MIKPWTKTITEQNPLAILIIDAVVRISSVYSSSAATLLIRCDDKEYVLAQMNPNDVITLNQQLKLEIFEHVELICKGPPGTRINVAGTVQGDAKLLQPPSQKQKETLKENAEPTVKPVAATPEAAVKPVAATPEPTVKVKVAKASTESTPVKEVKKTTTKNDEAPKTADYLKLLKQPAAVKPDAAKPEEKVKPTTAAAPAKEAKKDEKVVKKDEKVVKKDDPLKQLIAAAKEAPTVPKTEPVKRKTLNCGVHVEIVRAGKGQMARAGQRVVVKYDGRLASNGKRFDKGSIPFRLGMGEVIRGWDEGVKGMLVGESRKLLIPAHAAYGARGAPPTIPPNSKLLFDVELLKVA